MHTLFFPNKFFEKSRSEPKLNHFNLLFSIKINQFKFIFSPLKGELVGLLLKTE